MFKLVDTRLLTRLDSSRNPFVTPDNGSGNKRLRDRLLALKTVQFSESYSEVAKRKFLDRDGWIRALHILALTP